MTVQLYVAERVAGRKFYTTLFGREPDFAPEEDFLEWRVADGAEFWVQLVAGQQRPLPTRLRLRVEDIRAAIAWSRTALGVDPNEPEDLLGVVSYTDFTDPWGNRLGFYQDLITSSNEAMRSAGS
jgi:catechol 2,3-dioxygenase-like lactoylglutathione lyase family enzyme